MEIDEFKIQIGKRLLEFAEAKGLNPSKLAELLDYKYFTLSKVLNGQNGLSMDLALSIKTKFPDLSFDWLFTGEGQMAIKNSNVVIGENNGTMQINHPPSPEVLAERVRALERELQLKDEIISLLKK